MSHIDEKSVTDILSLGEPIARKTSAEQIASRLIEMVQSGNLRSGDKLPSENELARAFAVSRPVVREALRGLAIAGIIYSRQGYGYTVSTLTTAALIAPIKLIMSLDEYDISDHYKTRLVIDSVLAKEACKNTNDEDLLKLDCLVKQGYELAKNPTAFRILDAEFHQYINNMANMPLLEKISISLYELGLEFRRVASEQSGVLDQSAKDHEDIVEGLRARDEKATVAAFCKHLDNVLKTTVIAKDKLHK